MKKIMVLMAFVMFCFALWSLPTSQTGGVNVSVTPGYNSSYPTASYYSSIVVYYGTTTNLSTDQLVQVPFTTTNITVMGLSRGSTYYFTATQIGTNSLESDPCGFVSYSVPNKPPKPGTITTN